VEVHEVHEHAEEAHHKNNKRAALLIIVLAAALAIIEMAGKEAQFESIAHNIETADLYAFYQAKTIRSTVVRAAIEQAQLLPGDAQAPNLAADRQKQFESWKQAGERLDSDPKSGEGRKELLERAKKQEELRDHKIKAYHDYEYAAALMQLAIVMASAAVITEVMALEFVSGAFGLVGLAFALLGWLAPEMLPL
jgi:hypothetical protein